MLRAFNAFQILLFFVVLPFLIQWLSSGPFPYSFALLCLSVAVYVAMFITGVVLLTDRLTEER